MSSDPGLPAAEQSAPTTAERLRAAALAEFNDHGVSGTDTNRIARRAGFAPQTFYRWYADKIAIFLAVYRDWEARERGALEALLAENATSETLVESIVAHHRDSLGFRRSLRDLAVADAAVRQARAESRRRQLLAMAAATGRLGSDPEAEATILLQIERLADAIAEGEFADMGLGDSAARAALAALIERLRAPTVS